MTENKRFKNALIEFEKAKKELENEKRTFVFDVETFMLKNRIPIKVLFFGDSFGLDINLNIHDWSETPRKIPLSVLTSFCDEFGCEFECTVCDGNRWIFNFNGMDMRF